MGISPVGQLIHTPKVAELIAHHLRVQIVRGELPAGDILPRETELMGQFGVSRPTLREAFRILETESLIRVRQGSNGGAQVTTPRVAVAARHVGLLLQLQGAAIADVHEARSSLEPACVRLLVQRRTEADVAVLRALIDDIRSEIAEPANPKAPRRFVAFRFHRALVHLAGNKTMAVQAGVLNDIVATHLDAAGHCAPDDPTELAELHRRLIRSLEKVVDLIEDGDVDGAEDHWRHHMQVAAVYLLGDDRDATVNLFRP